VLQSQGAVLRMPVLPGEVYPLIRERSPVLWPMVLVAAVGVVTGLVMLPALQEIAMRQVALDPNLPEEAAAMVGPITTISALIGGALGQIFRALIAAALMAVAVLFTGGRLPYRLALSLSLTAYGPVLLASLLVAVMTAAGVVEFPTGTETSAAMFLGREAAGTLLYRLLALIDPFEWWYIALLAGGIRALADTTPRAGWVIAVLVWLVLFGGPTLLATSVAL